MGWWSSAVMGGDGPCDIQCTIRDMLELSESFFDRFGDAEKPSKRDVKKVRSVFAKPGFMQQVIDFVEAAEMDEADIGYQVLGVMLMEFGIPISDVLKARIVKAAEDDEWAQDDEERKASMDSFIADLNKYNGEPSPLSQPDQGLLGTIFDALESGKKGLINK